MLSEDTVKAETIWSLEALKNKYSYQSCAIKSSFFAEMFKDSKIAQIFTVGKTKCSYVICYGIATYCKDLLMGALEITAFIVILLMKRSMVVSKMARWTYTYDSGMIATAK